MERTIELLKAAIEEIKQVQATAPTRERALVLTNLQQAYLWATAEHDTFVQR